MKITLNVDGALLARAKEMVGTTNTTQAIDIALRDFVRQGALLAALEAGKKLTPDDWYAAIDRNYDLAAMRAAETPVTPYGRKPRSRR